jgi:hypothetical protein
MRTSQMRTDAVEEMILRTVADKGPQNVQDISDMLENVPAAIGDNKLYLVWLSVSVSVSVTSTPQPVIISHTHLILWYNAFFCHHFFQI